MKNRMRIQVVSAAFLLAMALNSCKNTQKVPALDAGLTQNEPVAESVKSQEVSTPTLSAMKGKFMLIDSSTVRIFLDATITNLDTANALEAINKQFKIGWAVNSDYSLRDRLASGKIEALTSAQFQQEGIHSYITFDFQRPPALREGVLLVEFADYKASKKYINDFFIDFTGKRVSDRFQLFEANDLVPMRKGYLVVGKEYELKSINPSNEKLYLVKYTSAYGPSPSPMSSQKNQDVRELPREFTKEVASNSKITLDSPGFYALLRDSTTTENSFGFLVVNDRFPRFTFPDQLAEPLIYMSTNPETQAIRQNPIVKDALDLHFLQLMGGDTTKAKNTIRLFYKRVEEANDFFTSYKEGWKTDKGMIYVVMGPPNRIQKSRDREIWLYSQSRNFSEILFTFYRKPTNFIEDHYELVRYPEYQSYWYPIVEAWRTGNVVE